MLTSTISCTKWVHLLKEVNHRWLLVVLHLPLSQQITAMLPQWWWEVWTSSTVTTGPPTLASCEGCILLCHCKEAVLAEVETVDVEGGVMCYVYIGHWKHIPTRSLWLPCGWWQGGRRVEVVRVWVVFSATFRSHIISSSLVPVCTMLWLGSPSITSVRKSWAFSVLGHYIFVTLWHGEVNQVGCGLGGGADCFLSGGLAV